MTSRIPALVIGAGISGLTCAYALRKSGIDAQVVEADERPGGLIRSEERDGFLFELGPQSFSGTAALRNLCTELGITRELVEAPPKAPRYILVNGSLCAVPLSPPAMLTTSLLSVATKSSIARDAFGKTKPPQDDESIASFMRRKFTAELLDRLAGPFVSGIYAGDPERLSLRSTFPQIYEAEKSAGSAIRGMIRAARNRKEPRERPTLLSFRDGNEALVRALAAKLDRALRLETAAVKIIAKFAGGESAFEVTLQRAGRAETLIADRLIIATPTDAAGRLLRDVSAAFEPLLCGIEYAPIAIVSLGYRREDVAHDLSGFGFLVPRSTGLRVLGTVWNSSLFPNRAPKGFVLMTSFVGGATDPEAVSLSSENLVNLVHREISALLGSGKAPVCSNVQIYKRALPQYNLGHTARLAALENLCREIPNLAFTGNYLHGPSIGACVEQSLAVAESIARARAAG